MRSDPSARPGSRRWDPAFIWLTAIEFVVLVALTAILITAFGGAGFWPWLVMAGAIVLGWLAGVLILVPRSAPRR